MSTTDAHPAADGVVFDHDFAQDPHVRYALMREEAPAQRIVTTTGLPGWVITRYAEARAALTDPRFGKDVKRTREAIEERLIPGADHVAFSNDLAGHMLNLDPPDHTRLRKLVVKAFTAKRVESLRPRVEAITDELLDGMAGQSEVDLLDSFAFPLPITVISELLGVDESHRSDFRKWSNDMIDGGDPVATSASAEKMGAYLIGLVESKRGEPGDDLISALIETGENEDRLDARELVSMAFLLLIAGHETTVNLIGNTVLALLRNPEQLDRLRNDPSLVAGAVEEGLRFDGPVLQATLRHTTEAVTVGEVEIPAREIVWVGLSAANRDEDKFEDPDRFDITRSTTGHLAFGHGIHFCLGAPLARLEGQVALAKLVERFPNMRASGPLDDLTWRYSTLIRGMERFPVRLD